MNSGTAYKPQLNEEYFYITDTLSVGLAINRNSTIDKTRIAFLNCFSDLESAQRAGTKIRKLLVEVPKLDTTYLTLEERSKLGLPLIIEDPEAYALAGESL